ncbi:hypothetical protein PCE1_001873 [Barthelona sp. PCE]
MGLFGSRRHRRYEGDTVPLLKKNESEDESFTPNNKRQFFAMLRKLWVFQRRQRASLVVQILLPLLLLTMIPFLQNLADEYTQDLQLEDKHPPPLPLFADYWNLPIAYNGGNASEIGSIYYFNDTYSGGLMGDFPHYLSKNKVSNLDTTEYDTTLSMNKWFYDVIGWHKWQSIQTSVEFYGYSKEKQELNITIGYNRRFKKAYEQSLLFTGVGMFHALHMQYISDLPPISIPTMRQFPHHNYTTSLDVSRAALPGFMLFLLQFPCAVIVYALLYERERGMTQLLKTVGLKTYYKPTLLFFFMFSFVLYLFTYAIGWLYGLDYLMKSSFFVFIALFIMVGINAVAVSCLFSRFFKKTNTGTLFAYIWVFISSDIANVIRFIFLGEDQFAFSLFVLPSQSILGCLKAIGMNLSVEQDPLSLNGIFDFDTRFGRNFFALFINTAILSVLSYLIARTETRRQLVKPIAESIAIANTTSYVPEDSVVDYETAVAQKERAIECLMRGDLKNKIIALDVTKKYTTHGDPANDRISCVFEAGHVYGLLGASAAGKTTFIQSLCGINSITSGSIYFGKQTYQDESNIDINFVPQDNRACVYDELTGFENLQFYCRLKGMKEEDIPEHIEFLLNGVDLLEHKDKKAGEYSGGMKRRLATATGFVGNPRYIFMDEISTGLDVENCEFLTQFVHGFVKKDRIIISSTHSLSEAESLATDIILLGKGKVQVFGKPVELKEKFGQGYKVDLTCTDAALAIFKENFPEAMLIRSMFNSYSFLLKRDDYNEIEDLFSELKSVIDANEGFEFWSTYQPNLSSVFEHVLTSAQSE